MVCFTTIGRIIELSENGRIVGVYIGESENRNNCADSTILKFYLKIFMKVIHVSTILPILQFYGVICFAIIEKIILSLRVCIGETIVRRNSYLTILRFRHNRTLLRVFSGKGNVMIF